MTTEQQVGMADCTGLAGIDSAMCYAEHWFHHGQGVLGPKWALSILIGCVVMYFIVKPILVAYFTRKKED